MTDMLLGRTLGDYKLDSRLTSGGMAHIYMGVDENLGRRAAVKILTPDMGSNDETLTGRFEREARAIAQLEHDSIVTIYQFGKDKDLYFLAMRYIEGNDLSDELKKIHKSGKLMDVDRVMFILKQVASALDYAHSQGIIHRDVKPSNVLLGKKDKALLSDFGLVLWKSADVTTGTAFGTPRYISPEQATDSASVVPQSDIYSLGVMMYELLTGSPPFTGNTPMEVALAHLTETPVPPRALNTTIPADAQHEILKAMSKDPNDRHDLAVDFIEAVRKAYEGVKKTRKDVSEAAATTLAFLDDTEGSAPEILSGWDNHKTLVDKPDTDPEIVPAIPRPNADDRPQLKSLASISKKTTPLEKKQPAISSEKKKTRRSPALLIATLLLVVIGGGLALVAGGGNNATDTTPDSDNGETVVVSEISPTEDVVDVITDTPEVDEPDIDIVVVSPDTATARLFYRDDVFAFVNISDAPLDIEGLQLQGESDVERELFVNDGLLGDELAPGECILIRNRDGRNLDIPVDWNCDPVQEATMGRLLFWRADTMTDSAFTVQSGDDVQTTCETTGRAVRRLDGTDCYVDWSQTG